MPSERELVVLGDIASDAVTFLDVETGQTVPGYDVIEWLAAGRAPIAVETEQATLTVSKLPEGYCRHNPRSGEVHNFYADQMQTPVATVVTHRKTTVYVRSEEGRR